MLVQPFAMSARINMRHARSQHPTSGMTLTNGPQPDLTETVVDCSVCARNKEALMPGPPPEHPHLRLLKGNPGKRRVRVPPEPARSEACPSPPEYLTGYAREAWLHLAPELHRLNLLTVLDVGPFSATAALIPTGNKPKRRYGARAS